MFTEQEICSTTGLTLAALRTVCTILFGSSRDVPPRLTAGEALLILLYHSLTHFGYTPESASSVCINFRQAVNKIGLALSSSEDTSIAHVLMIQDGNLVHLEGYDTVFDMAKQEMVKASTLGPPTVYCGVVLGVLYRRTLSKILSRRSEEEVPQAAQTSA